ncbi:MAG: hypothetical protein DMG97_40560 [Acidobacteria bacterium]|nr:MAG: hypothetical protein DMG97_40560 [Acidobacteriota bacterium]
MLEKPHSMPGVFELVDIGPDFGLPGQLVDCRLSAAGATGVQFGGHERQRTLRLKFDEDAANFLDFVIFADDMFVAQNVIKAQLTGFALGLGTSVERPVFGPQLLGGVAGHPKRFLVDHSASPREDFT